MDESLFLEQSSEEGVKESKIVYLSHYVKVKNFSNSKFTHWSIRLSPHSTIDPDLWASLSGPPVAGKFTICFPGLDIGSGAQDWWRKSIFG
jgi:hypothetical protein